MDESNPTCNKRFAQYGIPQTEEARLSYRELIVTTPGLGEFISGAILYDETIRQSGKDGTPLIKLIADAGIIPGIKVDTGAKDMAGHPREKITEGLDGLRARLAKLARGDYDRCRNSQPGIAFLSGGQAYELASARLNAINSQFKNRLPWALTFSFSRAIQQPALEIWKGEESNMLATQQALYHRARCNSVARRGEYNAAMERAT